MRALKIPKGPKLGWYQLPSIVDRPEAAVTYLPEVVEDLVRVLALEQLRHVGVLQGPGPGDRGHGGGGGGLGPSTRTHRSQLNLPILIKRIGSFYGE